VYTNSINCFPKDLNDDYEIVNKPLEPRAAAPGVGICSEFCVRADLHHAAQLQWHGRRVPQAGVVQAANGELYGTTPSGGANCTSTPDLCGTVFKIAPSGALTTLYNFCSKVDCLDGKGPLGGLLEAPNGDLYGTTYGGGAQSAGTVFKVTRTGTLSTLYNFCAQAGCTDGGSPEGGMVQAANGDLYGTTQVGGAYGGGTVFKITTSGTLTTLYSFCALSACADGEFPDNGLIQATNGVIYGTTSSGGITSCSGGCGTAFKITPSGELATIYSFCSQPDCADGEFPAGLVQARDGDLYGVTQLGGITNSDCPFGCGTVFEMSLSGAFTTLHSFCSQAGCPDGEQPFAALVRAAGGDLYGTTQGLGTIFKITSSGSITTLYTFCSQSGCADGYAPNGLFLGTNGIFYGTAGAGGTNAHGTVFSLFTGQPPFVETHPTIGVVGEKVTILGYELTGATSVTFNGIPAAFTVDASTAISTTVPAGATTGKVQVITPTATLSSNVSFEVAP
jgi:uncharacterized repeat protein (TIGR03803 family)